MPENAPKVLDDCPLSRVGISNVFTKLCCQPYDFRQRIAKIPGVPSDGPTRKLLGALVVEEVFELLKALGLQAAIKGTVLVEFKDIELVPIPQDEYDKVHPAERLDDVIDAAGDVDFTAIGVIIACGRPDKPHLRRICDANDSKIVNGAPVINPETGKYMKPPGFTAPDHVQVLAETPYTMPQRIADIPAWND